MRVPSCSLHHGIKVARRLYTPRLGSVTGIGIKQERALWSAVCAFHHIVLTRLCRSHIDMTSWVDSSRDINSERGPRAPPGGLAAQIKGRWNCVCDSIRPGGRAVHVVIQAVNEGRAERSSAVKAVRPRISKETCIQSSSRTTRPRYQRDFSSGKGLAAHPNRQHLRRNLR